MGNTVKHGNIIFDLFSDMIAGKYSAEFLVTVYNTESMGYFALVALEALLAMAED